ncbi:FadR/GntR family transcriptional regulator [Corticimicrobacter populi]|uniref:GntR family transcriptional regulator n=1 Tax=Corticimicrobacter populi TaxID=2175229 RepID=A0A2V1JWW4_9BURK|nr:GntR family transcriptional regulator [Corticimicrobacter populi]PWF21860.1 GntR family transcriptional regulator [Corticimicrobacter populi]
MPAFSAQPLRRKNRTLAEEAVAALMHPIQQGIWQTGDKLPSEAELIRQLGVSRTVVREAISRLQAQGRVETRQGVGTFVLPSPVSTCPQEASPDSKIEDSAARLELFRALASESAALAALRRTSADLARLRHAASQLSLAPADSELDPQTEIQQAARAFFHALADTARSHYLSQHLATLGYTASPEHRLPADSHAAAAQRNWIRQEYATIIAAIQEQDATGARQATCAYLSRTVA